MAASYQITNLELPYFCKAIAGPASNLLAFASDGAVTTYSRSADGGETWSQIARPLAGAINSLNWNGTQFLAVMGDSYAVSANGTSWTTGTLPAASGSGSGLAKSAWSGTHWVVNRGNRQGTVSRSSDGTTWTNYTLSGCYDTYDVLWDGARFLVTGSDIYGDESYIYASTSGTSWSLISTLLFASGRLNSLIYNGTGYVSYGDSSSDSVRSSSDAVTWSNPASLPSRAYGGVVVDGDLILLTNPFSGVPEFYKSADGATWTLFSPSGEGALEIYPLLIANYRGDGASAYLHANIDSLPYLVTVEPYTAPPPTPPPPPPPDTGPLRTDYTGTTEPTTTLNNSKLVKDTMVQTIPGTPGNDGVPPVPATPPRSYTVPETVCAWRLSGGSYQWVTDDNGNSSYLLVPEAGATYATSEYSCVTTQKTVYVPGSPGSPGIPPTPPSPAQTLTDYNLGWNSGARSVGFFNADGFVEFVPVVATGIVVGLNDTDESPGYFEMEHAWYFSGGVARVYENGAEVAYSGPFVIDSDVFKIERRGAMVRYLKNDTPVYTSAKPSYGPVFLDASMYSGGDMLADAVIAPMVSAGPVDPDTGEVGLRIPMMQLLGYEDAYATATLRVPMPTISAGMLSKATLTIPMPTMLGADRLYGAATLSVPMPTMTASGGFPVPAYALATLIVPRPAMTAFGLTGEIGGAALTVPMMDMIASEGPYGEATLTVPAPRMVASAYEGNGQAFMHEFMLPQISLAPQLVTALVMNEDMTVAAVMTMGFTATADMAESLTVDDSLSAAAQRLASLFSVVNVGSAVPVVNAVGGAAGPGGVAGDDPYHPDVRLNSDVQVWAMDWDTAATTSYENYAYNSFAVIDGKAYGCKADGIYLLEGEDDNGVPVRASANFGSNDFGTSHQKAVPHAYVGVAADGQVYLRVQVDGGTSHTYQARSVTANQKVQRFDFGKGLKGSYYTFELFNKDGADFDLDKIEFMPMALSRRI